MKRIQRYKDYKVDKVKLNNGEINPTKVEISTNFYLEQVFGGPLREEDTIRARLTGDEIMKIFEEVEKEFAEKRMNNGNK